MIIRTILIYFIITLIMRLMGKREIGKLSVLDLVISVMIAEIAVIVIEDIQRPLWEGIVPMIILLIIQVGTALMTMNNRKLRLLFDGKPSVIIAKGKIDRDIMKKQRYNLDDLLLQLRENQITSVADVEFAILETSGKLSVIPKEGRFAQESDKDSEGSETPDVNVEKSSVTPYSKGREEIIPRGFRYEILPIPLIMDGKVQDENLIKIEKTRFWLKNVLQEQGVTNFKDVFLCTIDHKGKLFVDIVTRKRTT
ncbi:YetF domain-containing protein [Paenibacillus chungangensis]